MEGAPPPGMAKTAPRVGKTAAKAPVPVIQAVEAVKVVHRLSETHVDSLKAALRDLGDARKLLDPAVAR
jgi:hypothetical protein